MSIRRLIPIAVGVVGLVAVACSSAATSQQPAVASPSSGRPLPETQSSAPIGQAPDNASAAQQAENTPVALPEIQSSAPIGQAPDNVSAAQQAEITPVPKPESSPTPTVNFITDPNDQPPLFMSLGWRTDFSLHTVPYSEIRSGGPPRDGIPPIDRPKFHDVGDTPDYLEDNEPVISVEINGDAKAYPLAILISHEIVNDTLGGVPITVSYCPLCNTAITFDRRVDGRLLDFGTSGNLRRSDLVMWDRQTESWWQQITGEAIVGELAGTKLKFIPSPVVSWREFENSFPDGQVLSRDTGFRRNYGLPPYDGYDEIGQLPFLFAGNIDKRLDAMERVVALDIDGQTIAYPFLMLQEILVVNDTFAGQDIAIFFATDTRSAFAGFGYSANRTVGSSAVYDPNVNGQKLTFAMVDGVIVDDQTGSAWTILGEAVDGELVGTKLSPIVHGNHFWFAWAAFNPDTEVRSAANLVN